MTVRSSWALLYLTTLSLNQGAVLCGSLSKEMHLVLSDNAMIIASSVTCLGRRFWVEHKGALCKSKHWG